MMFSDHLKQRLKAAAYGLQCTRQGLAVILVDASTTYRASYDFYYVVTDIIY
jgi:hypothetical protein